MQDSGMGNTESRNSFPDRQSHPQIGLWNVCKMYSFHDDTTIIVVAFLFKLTRPDQTRLNYPNPSTSSILSLLTFQFVLKNKKKIELFEEQKNLLLSVSITLVSITSYRGHQNRIIKFHIEKHIFSHPFPFWLAIPLPFLSLLSPKFP